MYMQIYALYLHCLFYFPTGHQFLFVFPACKPWSPIKKLHMTIYACMWIYTCMHGCPVVIIVWLLNQAWWPKGWSMYLVSLINCLCLGHWLKCAHTCVYPYPRLLKTTNMNEAWIINKTSSLLFHFLYDICYWSQWVWPY